MRARRFCLATWRGRGKRRHLREPIPACERKQCAGRWEILHRRWGHSDERIQRLRRDCSRQARPGWGRREDRRIWSEEQPEDLDAVAGFVIRVDRHGEESAGFREVLPGVLRNVAKGSIASGGKLAHKHGGAGGSIIGIGGVCGIFLVGVLFLGGSAAHREPPAVGTEGERLDTVHGG